MISVLRGTRIDIHILRARFTHGFDALIHIAIGDLRLGIRDLNAPVVPQFELRRNLKLSLEADITRIRGISDP